MLKLDRVLFSAVHYPANYGFIPQTYCEDNDPLDILVLCSVKIEPMCLVEAKVIGVMHMLDQGEKDDKIIAIARNDKSLRHIDKLEDIPQHLLDEVHRFFEDYKKLENKEVVVEKFVGKEEAWEVVNRCIKLYDTKFRSQIKKVHVLKPGEVVEVTHAPEKRLSPIKHKPCDDHKE
jgi:inorganic pyrophosphatase